MSDQHDSETPVPPARFQRGTGGDSELVQQLQQEERARHRADAAEDDTECVDEQVRETFPASDSPGNY